MIGRGVPLAVVLSTSLLQGCGSRSRTSHPGDAQIAARAERRAGSDDRTPANDPCRPDRRVTVSRASSLPADGAVGANAWLELEVAPADAAGARDHVILAGSKVPIVSAGARAGIIGLRIPPAMHAGSHELSLARCEGRAASSMTIVIAPTNAPTIASVTVLRGQQFPKMVIKGVGLSSVDRIVLASANRETVAVVTDVTRVDETEVRGPIQVEAPGAYDVFVHAEGGLGGGPPNGVVTLP